jgi:hypothetical protein
VRALAEARDMTKRKATRKSAKRYSASGKRKGRHPKSPLNTPIQIPFYGRLTFTQLIEKFPTLTGALEKLYIALYTHAFGSLEAAQRWIDKEQRRAFEQRIEKLNLLCDKFNIPRGEWCALSLALAKQLYPKGFEIIDEPTPEPRYDFSQLLIEAEIRKRDYAATHGKRPTNRDVAEWLCKEDAYTNYDPRTLQNLLGKLYNPHHPIQKRLGLLPGPRHFDHPGFDLQNALDIVVRLRAQAE